MRGERTKGNSLCGTFRTFTTNTRSHQNTNNRIARTVRSTSIGLDLIIDRDNCRHFDISREI